MVYGADPILGFQSAFEPTGLGGESHSPRGWFTVRIGCNTGGPGETVLYRGSHGQIVRVGRFVVVNEYNNIIHPMQLPVLN